MRTFQDTFKTRKQLFIIYHLFILHDRNFKQISVSPNKISVEDSLCVSNHSMKRVLTDSQILKPIIVS